jgi:ABC-type cobalamin transport system permease subunit
VRTYLMTTAALFGLIALAHVLRTIAESSRLTTDPGFLLEGPGLGILAGLLCAWAITLLRRTPRST